MVVGDKVNGVLIRRDTANSSPYRVLLDLIILCSRQSTELMCELDQDRSRPVIQV
jgi:hypothetical protein